MHDPAHGENPFPRGHMGNPHASLRGTPTLPFEPPPFPSPGVGDHFSIMARTAALYSRSFNFTL
eukprot:1672202-Prymnesium_polylepis.1